jgi:hypothetical protein
MFEDSAEAVLAAAARAGNGVANLSMLSDHDLRKIEAGYAADFIMATNDGDQKALLAASRGMEPVSAELRRRRTHGTLGPILGDRHLGPDPNRPGTKPSPATVAERAARRQAADDDSSEGVHPAERSAEERKVQLRRQFAKLRRRKIKPMVAAASALTPAGRRGAAPAPVVVAAGPGSDDDGLPGWSAFVPPLSTDEQGRPLRRSREEADRLVAQAQADHERWRQQGAAARLAAGRIDPASIVWQPFRWLVAAVEQAPEDCPAWAVTVWCTALVGPGRVIGPLIPDEQHTFARLAWAVDDWAVAWHLCEQLAGARHNQMPSPALAERATFRSPETAWTALQGAGDPLTSNGLLAGLWLLLGDRRDPTVRIKANTVTGDDPCTRLAGCLLGPAAAGRGLGPERANLDTRLHAFGPGSPMVRAAERLHGGPLPPDASVLDQLTVEQRRAIADLARDT